MYNIKQIDEPCLHKNQSETDYPSFIKKSFKMCLRLTYLMLYNRYTAYQKIIHNSVRIGGRIGLENLSVLA